VAVPFLIAVVRSSWKLETDWSTCFAFGALGAFFVSPYARHYDFPILLIPAMLLMTSRLPLLIRVLLPLALVLLPYVQFSLLQQWKAEVDPDGKFIVEGTFFWVPLILAAGWFTSPSNDISATPALQPSGPGGKAGA
jgi:hypothetical protein